MDSDTPNIETDPGGKGEASFLFDPYCCDHEKIGIDLPEPIYSGSESTERIYTSMTSKLTVDAHYEHGTYTYSTEPGFDYSLSLQVRKFGNPYAALLSVNGTSYTVTDSLITYEITNESQNEMLIVLHTIANAEGDWGGIELRNIHVTKTSCVLMCKDNECEDSNWEDVPLTEDLFTREIGDGSLTILSDNELEFSSLNGEVSYLLEVLDDYEYKLEWSMHYDLDPNSHEIATVYPDLGDFEYTSTNNYSIICALYYRGTTCPCEYGKVVSSIAGKDRIYYGEEAVFKDITSIATKFRVLADHSGGSLTIRDFHLQRRFCE